MVYSMTYLDFTELLSKVTDRPMPESVTLALTNYPESRPIERRHAAKLVHLYLRDVLGAADEEDLSKANELVDLYDCHTCAGDIAQVYLKGIMPAKRFPEFGTMDRIEEAEAELIVKKLSEYHG